MTQPLAPPSRDPADDGTLLGALNVAFRARQMAHEGMLPATAGIHDRTTNRGAVTPSVQAVTSNGDVLDRPPVASIVTMQLGGGGFVLNFPVSPGDTGFVFAADRDTSLVHQAGAPAPPNTKQLHSFSSGAFLPAVLSGGSIAAEDAAHAVLQALDGSVRLALWPDRVKITAPRLEIDCPQVKITGTVTVTGDVVAGGNNVSLVNHLHGGVTSGGDDTGVPT